MHRKEYSHSLTAEPTHIQYRVEVSNLGPQTALIHPKIFHVPSTLPKSRHPRQGPAREAESLTQLNQMGLGPTSRAEYLLSAKKYLALLG